MEPNGKLTWAGGGVGRQRRPMRILVLGILILGCCPTARASGATAFIVRREACFNRVYDAAHLAAHPQQKVRHIRLTAQPNGRGAITAGLNVWLRGSGVRYAAYAFCRFESGRTTCRSEFDDRVWGIRQENAKTVRIENGGIWVNPWDYDAEDRSERGTRLKTEPDDESWLLSATTCSMNPND